MKKTIATIAAFFMVVSFSYAQITFEADYEHSGTYVKLASSGNKFYIMDVGLSQCRVYNTDHSLWKTINLDIPDNNYLYDIRYVSENLFTSDNSLSLCYIYYYYDNVAQYYTYTLKIINENGTNLLTISGVQYAYVCNIDDDGTKLVAYVYDYSVIPYTITTVIYDLPGELLSSAPGQALQSTIENAFPNPATSFSVVPYNLPDGATNGEIQILDMQGKTMQTYNVDNQFDHLRISTGQLPRGTYLYRLVAGNFSSKANKLIVK
jgi:hypothetical protein